MRQSQTPDFRVMVGDRLAFYCEVKTSHYDDWLDRQLDEAPPGTLAGGLRPDPTYNRVSNYIHRAVGQLDAVNAACEFPNVVAIVNNDLKAGLADLLSVLTGNAYTDGAAIRMFESSSGGRIREEKHRIHLYLWFDVGTLEPFKLWTISHAEHHSALCGYLGIDPASIRQI
jgi:hypothetical protein